MAMQLFSFGHPCEHQLHRACIGGSNCPLNGYPDTWCCSFVKGKINFRRDRPCEGPRCHWDFVHPTQSQFDEVTQVLDQSRPIAAKLDEARDTDLLSFTINNPHIIDTVQCALHMMRHPPSSCARRVGQLLAYAAVLAGDQDVFVQLLKTMKKPVDGYILGAYAYLTQSKPNSATAGSEKGGSTNQRAANKKQSKKKEVKDDISATLANIMVELMNAALSLGGQLVDREDQHVLQAMLIKALSTYPKSDRRHQEMLEKAIAKFGNRKLDDEEEAAAKREAARREAAAVAAAAAAAAKEAANPTNGAAAPATKAGGELTGATAVAEDTTAAARTTNTTTAAAPTAAMEVPAATAEAPSSAAATPLKAPSAERETAATAPPPRLPSAAASAAAADPHSPHEEASTGPAPSLPAAAVATPNMVFSSAPGTPDTAVVTAAVTATGPFTIPAVFSTIAHPTTAAAPPTNLPAAAVATTPFFTTSAVSAGRPPTTPSAAAAAALPQPPAATAPGPVVGISKVLQVLSEDPNAYFKSALWEPVSRSGPMPNLYLCGGQFTVKSHLWGPTPLGDATPLPIMDAATKGLVRYLETMEANQAAAEEERRAAQAADDRLAALRQAWNWVDSDSSWCCYSEGSDYWRTGSDSDE